ncbi:MAG TPA: hypothetical protein VGQ65_09630 [Thermoanaerobaculia bacterium]|nr:hypothetical protein [Thermoanaerobaculia bacterium]
MKRLFRNLTNVDHLAAAGCNRLDVAFVDRGGDVINRPTEQARRISDSDARLVM